ncbi:MAG: hypothetical protein JWM59_1857 [Verrucomicrobiales bacterium]|nr:hypothetical protein [Verrucomicrobiales bacterium]
MSAPRKFRRRAPRALRRQPRLKVSAALSRELIKFADLLEIRPADLLSWQLADLVRDFNCPTNRLLSEWAHNVVDYADPEVAARVRERVTAWLDCRRAVLKAKAAKGGQLKSEPASGDDGSPQI